LALTFDDMMHGTSYGWLAEIFSLTFDIRSGFVLNKPIHSFSSCMAPCQKNKPVAGIIFAQAMSFCSSKIPAKDLAAASSGKVT